MSTNFKLSGVVQGSQQELFTTSTDMQMPVGARMEDGVGGIYRYIKAGAAVSAGHLVQAPAPYTTALHAVAVNTAAKGDEYVTVTAGAEAVAANALAGGILTVVTGTAIGDSYSISGNTAVTAAGGSMTITLESPIRTTFGASDTVAAFANPCNGAYEVASSTRQPVGIAVEDIASGSYGWVKSRGLIGALADETIDAGCWLTSGTSTAGSVEELDDLTTEITDNLVGFAVMAGVDGATNLINVACE
jgi:hypothetical protein